MKTTLIIVRFTSWKYKSNQQQNLDLLNSFNLTLGRDLDEAQLKNITQRKLTNFSFFKT